VCYLSVGVLPLVGPLSMYIVNHVNVYIYWFQWFYCLSCRGMYDLLVTLNKTYILLDLCDIYVSLLTYPYDNTCWNVPLLSFVGLYVVLLLLNNKLLMRGLLTRCFFSVYVRSHMRIWKTLVCLDLSCVRTYEHNTIEIAPKTTYRMQMSVS